METAPAPAPLQAEVQWCLERGRVFARCGVWTVTTQHNAANGCVTFSFRWRTRGEPDRELITLRTLPAAWSRYDPLFIAELVAELLTRATELHYEG